MLIRDLENIILKYADIKTTNFDNNYKHSFTPRRRWSSYMNYCNLCKKYKCEKMATLDIKFYQIKLSFVMENVLNRDNYTRYHYKNFQRILTNSPIVPEKDDITKYGWVTNSLYIDEYWMNENRINEEEDIRSDRIRFYEFMEENFMYIEERCMNFCKRCRMENRKIKLE